MSQAIVIRGTYAGQVFTPSEPLPVAEGPAELIVFPKEKAASSSPAISIFDLFGKAPVLRSAEDIEAQVRDERQAWGDE
jgi:hypothetical protein